MADHETGIKGVLASDEVEAQRLSERYPFELLGHALTMLAYVAAGNPIPEWIGNRAGQMEADADIIVGNVHADTPLGANQLAAAEVAETVISNLRQLGHITTELA